MRIHAYGGFVPDQAWKDEQIGVGVTRVPIDPDDYGVRFGRGGVVPYVMTDWSLSVVIPDGFDPIALPLTRQEEHA